MNEAPLPSLSFVLVGLLLVVMTLTSSFIARIPLSSAILYLGVGVCIGPWGLELLTLDPIKDAGLIECLTCVFRLSWTCSSAPWTQSSAP